MDTQAIDDQAHLANYDSDNEIENDDLGYHSEEYFDDAHEDDEKTNHSKWECLKILAWNKVGSEARDKLWDEITRVFDVDLIVRKAELEKKELNKDGRNLPVVTLWLKGRVNKDGEYQDDEIRSVGDKTETMDKIQRRNLAGSQGTDAMTLVLGRNNEVMHEEWKWSDVSPVEIHPINSSADEEGGTTVVGCDQNDASIRKEMQKRETVKSVGAKKTTRSIRKDSSSQDSQSKENVSVLPQAIKCRLWHLKKTTIIAEGTVYKSDGKIMLHNKALPKDYYNVSIDKSLVDAAFIPDVGSNDCITVLDAVGGFVAWLKNQVVLDPKTTPPSTIQMITGENKTAPKVQTKRKNVYVSSDAMQKEANKKRSQKALHTLIVIMLEHSWKGSLQQELSIFSCRLISDSASNITVVANSTKLQAEYVAASKCWGQVFGFIINYLNMGSWMDNFVRAAILPSSLDSRAGRACQEPWGSIAQKLGLKNVSKFYNDPLLQEVSDLETTKTMCAVVVWSWLIDAPTSEVLIHRYSRPTSLSNSGDGDLPNAEPPNAESLNSVSFDSESEEKEVTLHAHVLGDCLERLKVLEGRENATSKKKLVEAEMKLELAR
ncbi:hypothetical protein Tco_1080885, partial [Tanacetum coccineum]